MSVPVSAPAAARERTWVWVLALLVVALALQGARPLWDPDEGRYGVVALRMLRTGDWLTPTLHPEVVHFSKPPLVYWLMAAACGVLGPSEWALRLPSSLAFAGTVLLVARMARRLLPGREVVAGIVQATSLLPFIAANLVTTDSVLAFWETLAVGAWVDLRWANGGRRARWVFWLALAGGFLTKGPSSLLPLATVLAVGLWERLRNGAPARGSGIAAPAPMLACLAIGLGWFLFEAAHHAHLSAYWLGAEFVGRVSSSEFGRNPGVRGLLIAYLPVVLFGAQPWLAVALAGRRRRSPAAIEPAAHRLLWTWLAMPALVFVLVESRLPLYLLPLAPPASLLMARRLPAGWGRRGRWALCAWVLALLGLRGGSAAIPETADGQRFARELSVLLPSPPGELVFVDHRPHYSLAFYLDADVEWVRLYRPAVDVEPSYVPLYDTLQDELAEGEHRRYFLVEAKKAGLFERALAAYGYGAEALGSVERFVVFTDPRRRG